MITADQAYEAFRDANPAPVVEAEGLLSASEALREAQGAPSKVAPPETPRRSFRIGVLTAAAAFALIVVIGVVAYVASQGTDDDVADGPQVTTTLRPPTTTVPPTTATTVPSTTEPPPPPTITPETRALLDQFADAYGQGFTTLVPLLDPELQVTIRFTTTLVTWDLDALEEQFGFYEALNTSLELGDCRALDAAAVSCTLLRTDDLVRIEGLEPATDVIIALRFTDGLVTSWTENSPVFPEYHGIAVAPFATWLEETYPELPNPKVSSNSEAPWWSPQGDIVTLMPDLIAEYAASRGVTLDD